MNSYSSENACSIYRTKCIGSIQNSHVDTQGHGKTKWVKRVDGLLNSLIPDAVYLRAIWFSYAHF